MCTLTQSPYIGKFEYITRGILFANMIQCAMCPYYCNLYHTILMYNNILNFRCRTNNEDETNQFFFVFYLVNCVLSSILQGATWLFFSFIIFVLRFITTVIAISLTIGLRRLLCMSMSECNAFDFSIKKV